MDSVSEGDDDWIAVARAPRPVFPRYLSVEVGAPRFRLKRRPMPDKLDFVRRKGNNVKNRLLCVSIPFKNNSDNELMQQTCTAIAAFAGQT